MARNVGGAGGPDVGPAQTVFAASLTFETANVPELVTGEPETENSAGTDRPTLVTDPPPQVGQSAGTNERKVGTAGEPVLGPAQTVLADSVAFPITSVPEVVIGEPEIVNSTGTVCPTLVTVPVPGGRSVNDRARNEGTAGGPELGPAKTRLAV